uniref:C2H2-type domain-containing protein n=1 Tax=Plectus sambesii TaxID=2011161 RepID=A0A914V901_9BILA
MCDLCNEELSSRSALCDHRKRMHPDTIEIKEKNIACDSCEYTCSSNDALRKHRRSKDDALADGYVSPVSLSKAKWTVDAERVARFPVRSGEECTAFLWMKEREGGKIEARYCLQHFGHKKEPARLRLSKSEKEHIVNLVQEDHNVDWRATLLRLAEGCSSRGGPFGLNKGQRDPNDMLSIKKWVDEDTENGSPWNNFFDYHSATNTDGDGFHLGLMTEDQRGIIQQYAYRGVCVDSTHNCTRYKYKLVTLLIFDDIG